MSPSTPNAIALLGSLTTEAAGRIATSRCRAQPKTYVSSLIASCYSDRLLARTIHEYLLRRPILSPGWAFLGLLDGLHVRLRRPYLREAPAGFSLERLATAFMNNPG